MNKTGSAAKVKLNSFDDLFGNNEMQTSGVEQIINAPLAELTPEELEEIRKREERKDRLHQNYLKRKASGAQKRYEDKIKKRKKAEIEAKKAAIRAEDIAKGVFVPVSSLPQREPMKGVQTA